MATSDVKNVLNTDHIEASANVGAENDAFHEPVPNARPEDIEYLPSPELETGHEIGVGDGDITEAPKVYDQDDFVWELDDSAAYVPNQEQENAVKVSVPEPAIQVKVEEKDVHVVHRQIHTSSGRPGESNVPSANDNINIEQQPCENEAVDDDADADADEIIKYPSTTVSSALPSPMKDNSVKADNDKEEFNGRQIFEGSKLNSSSSSSTTAAQIKNEFLFQTTSAMDDNNVGSEAKQDTNKTNFEALPEPEKPQAVEFACGDGNVFDCDEDLKFEIEPNLTEKIRSNSANLLNSKEKLPPRYTRVQSGELSADNFPEFIATLNPGIRRCCFVCYSQFLDDTNDESNLGKNLTDNGFHKREIEEVKGNTTVKKEVYFCSEACMAECEELKDTFRERKHSTFLSPEKKEEIKPKTFEEFRAAKKKLEKNLEIESSAKDDDDLRLNNLNNDSDTINIKENTGLSPGKSPDRKSNCNSPKQQFFDTEKELALKEIEEELEKRKRKLKWMELQQAIGEAGDKFEDSD